MNVSDISNETCQTRDQEHIDALESLVDSLREEIRLLKSKKPTVVEVTCSDTVPKEKYETLQALYRQLWEDTQAF